MQDTFSQASRAWSRLDTFRAERARCKRYVYGDQWDDPICIDGRWQTEGELLREQGQMPLKNNILRRILRNVVGLYRAQYRVPQLTTKESGLKGRELKEANRRRREWFAENRMEELAPRLLEEFLLSGLVAVKVEGRRILPVTADNFFFHSDGYDPRGNDVDLIGETHRVSYGTLLQRFCRSAEDYRRIRDIYAGASHRPDSCRLTEVWTKETRLFALHHDEQAATLQVEEYGRDARPVRPRASIPTTENVVSTLRVRQRACEVTMARHSESIPGNSESTSMKLPSPDAGRTRSVLTTLSAWRCRWYADDGTLLREEDPQTAHPYVFKPYPFLDGEIHSYISDVIDQQRYVNRLITLYDFIMRSSAKGVLLFPDESLPRGWDLQDVGEEWSRFNGVLPYRAKPGVPMPTQVSANSTNIGITELLKIELQMLEDISGVSPTLQGQLQTNATSGTLFAQQNQAAQTSLLDVLSSFTDFLHQLALQCCNKNGPNLRDFR